MSKRRVVPAVVVVAVAAVATIVVVLTRPDDSVGGGVEQPGPARIYAYRTVHFVDPILTSSSEMVVMNGTTRIGRAPIGILGTDPDFTADGRYAFSFTDDQVVAISVATGKVTTVSCEGCDDRDRECLCQSVVPFGASTVAWLDNDNHLVRTDLATTAPTPQRTATTVPTWHNDWDEQVKPQLLAGTDGAVLAAYPHSLSDQTGPVYLVRPDGPPRQLAHGRRDSVEAAEFSPDGTQVALSGDADSTACATVTVVDLKSGNGRTSPVNATAACRTRDGYVGGMWWTPDGLNVYYQSAEDDLIDAHQRRFDGDHWTGTEAEQTTQAHQLNAGATAILSHPGVRDRDALYVEIDGHRTKIDDEVNRVTTAPR